MNLRPLEDLASEWRSEAVLFKRRGMEGSARQAESYAAELEGRLREWAGEMLTLAEAVEESGFSRSTLERRIDSGELPNVGEVGAPRVRRIDLPRKAGCPDFRTDNGAPDLASEILARRAST